MLHIQLYRRFKGKRMDINQFDKSVLVPALSLIGLCSPAAHALMLGTGILESNFDYIKQIGGGPALGVFQMEPATYNDIERYLKRYDNATLRESCLSACLYTAWPNSDALMYNLRWSAIMARIKYFMIPDKLPLSCDASALALYYKKYYNTAKGDAQIEKCIDTFKHVVTLLK